MSKQDPLQALLVRPGPWVLGDLLAPLALSGLEALPVYPAPSALRVSPAPPGRPELPALPVPQAR